MLTAALYAIFAAVFVLSLLAAERFLYYRRRAYETVVGTTELQTHTAAQATERANAKRAFHAWHLIRYRRHALRFVWLLRALVGICPLLGLLGTVAGMMTVFDTLAAARSGGQVIAFALAATHTTQAILPTLTGMLAAVPGAVCLWLIKRRVASGEHRLRAKLAA